VQKALELGAGAYVKKPYTIESLGRAVRSELEKHIVDRKPLFGALSRTG